MAVLRIVVRCVIFGSVVLTDGARCGDRRQPVPENHEDDGLVLLSLKERKPDVPRHSSFGQTGGERGPG